MKWSNSKPTPFIRVFYNTHFLTFFKSMYIKRRSSRMRSKRKIFREMLPRRKSIANWLGLHIYILTLQEKYWSSTGKITRCSDTSQWKYIESNRLDVKLLMNLLGCWHKQVCPVQLYSPTQFDEGAVWAYKRRKQEHSCHSDCSSRRERSTNEQRCINVLRVEKPSGGLEIFNVMSEISTRTPQVERLTNSHQLLLMLRIGHASPRSWTKILYSSTAAKY